MLQLKVLIPIIPPKFLWPPPQMNSTTSGEVQSIAVPRCIHPFHSFSNERHLHKFQSPQLYSCATRYLFCTFAKREQTRVYLSNVYRFVRILKILIHGIYTRNDLFELLINTTSRTTCSLVKNFGHLVHETKIVQTVAFVVCSQQSLCQGCKMPFYRKFFLLSVIITK